MNIATLDNTLSNTCYDKQTEKIIGISIEQVFIELKKQAIANTIIRFKRLEVVGKIVGLKGKRVKVVRYEK